MSASLRLLLLALATSSLAACDDAPKMMSESEVRAIAEQEASRYASVIDQNAGASNKLADRIDELERENEYLTRRVDLQQEQIDNHSAWLNNLSN